MYLFNFRERQLFDTQEVAKLLKAGESPVKVLRSALTQGNEAIKSHFSETMNATEAVQQRAWLVDQILKQAWKQCTVSESKSVAVIAVGGYGRGELHPASDIDLLILLDYSLDATTQACIERFITLLWDIRLQIGHSVRTLTECEQQAAKDITVITNLIEARLLIGQVSLFQELKRRLAPDRMWSSREFFAHKIEEKSRRYQKYHGSAYNLEPNIKENPGGLRDIQMVGWVAKRHFNVDKLYDLVQHGFLTEDEYNILVEGQEFIWRIRCKLHSITGRREDRLLFDYQRTLATAFDYNDDDAHLGVEKFMRQYYRTVKAISSLNDMLLQLFQEVILYANAPVKIYTLNKRFQVRNGFIEVAHDKVFMNDPFALLEIFLLMQQHPEIRGARASTLRLIRQYIWLIDENFRNDLRARSLFYEIIRQPQGLTRALRNMNHCEVLGVYVPAFGKVIGQMQYDLFHVYTVDQHTLFVVRNLRRFALLQYSHEFPLCSKIMMTLPKPELAYLAGLFHDIAKGRGGDHSQLGATDALNFCQAHGLSDYDARFVAWLVCHHLIMSTTAQRQDISDPSVIHAFAERVQDSTRLDYLYLLTVADIRATNPNLWNSWKDTLLTDLYNKTQRVFQQGTKTNVDRQERIHEVQACTLSLLVDQDIDDIIDLWRDLGDDYFLSSTPQDIARETLAILEQDDTELPLVLRRDSGGDGMEVIMFYTRDRDYLFADTTRFFEKKNLTIVDAFIIPACQDYTIACYTLLDDSGKSISNEIRFEGILLGLRETLSLDTGMPFYPINRRVPRQLKHFSVPTRISLHYNPHNNYTTLEVITTDRPGVLSCIAQALALCKVRIKKAKVATFGSRVEDIFFVTDHQNNPLHSADQVDCLREELSNLLEVEIFSTSPR
ncbi:MAG: [protein-PII] uridylyltransferase [Beggiatoa sp. IS2]|nr:MAG: [protein-PII] uridylyltransferase [Beggiatoa sp. IS2]